MSPDACRARHAVGEVLRVEQVRSAGADAVVVVVVVLVWWPRTRLRGGVVRRGAAGDGSAWRFQDRNLLPRPGRPDPFLDSAVVPRRRCLAGRGLGSRITSSFFKAALRFSTLPVLTAAGA